MSSVLETAAEILPDPDDMIAVEDVAAMLPRYRGKRVHRSTLYRWIDRGHRGIVLKSIKVGRHRFTTKEWLAAFVQAMSDDKPSATAEAERVQSEAERIRNLAAFHRLKANGF